MVLESYALHFLGCNGFQDSLVEEKMAEDLKSVLLPKCPQKLSR